MRRLTLFLLSILLLLPAHQAWPAQADTLGEADDEAEPAAAAPAAIDVGESDVSSLAGRPLQFRFVMRASKLFAFQFFKESHMPSHQLTRREFVGGGTVSMAGMAAGQTPLDSAAAMTVACCPDPNAGRRGWPDASFRITFGLKDAAPRSWQGELVPLGAQEVCVEPDRFGSQPGKGILYEKEPEAGPVPPFDYLRSETAWVCWTRRVPSGLDADEWVDRKDEQPETIIRAPSLLLHVFKGSDQPVRVKTASGAFEFVPAETRPFHPVQFLEESVRVERVPPALPPAAARLAQQDFPSLAATGSGELWVAWQEFDGRLDSVLAARKVDDAWTPVFVLAKQADVFHTAVAEDKRGRVWVIWSMQVDGQWHLYGRAYDGKEWSSAERLTGDVGPNCYHKAVTDSQGRLWLVWQKTLQGRSQIVATAFDGTQWSTEKRLSDGPSGAGDNWWPAVAAGPDGSLAVAWDGYASGSYDVYLRRFRNEQWGKVEAVADTPRFEAHPTVAIDRAGRVWVAWDESGPEWGKDVGFLVVRPGTRLRESREIKIACMDGQQKFTTTGDLEEVLSAGEYGESYELPHLEIGSDGSPWLFVRKLIKRQPDTPPHAPLNEAMWEAYALRYTGSRWEGPMFLPCSSGRNEMMPATAVDAQGRLWAVWATDNRSPQAWAPVQLQIQVAALPDVEKTESPALRPYVAEPEPREPIHPHEKEQVERIRAYRIHSRGKTYAIYRGDLHRHTDISLDGHNDGSLLDAYRYARDAAALDFLGVTDHNAHVQDPYAWWRTRKLADLFRSAGCFVTFYSYERSVAYPNGHRNVYFTHRDCRVTPIGQSEHSAWEGSQRLYAHLRRDNGFAISHTTGRWSGTDWRDNDEQAEPVVEIYQGMRDTYEYVGAPKPKRLETTFLDMSKPLPRAASYPNMPSFRPLGFVRNALALGYKLGFVASSDHISCHISYACVIAEKLDRVSLEEAIKARRTYAATDNIVLDVRYVGSDGEHLMGEQFHSSQAVQIQATVLGTGIIQQIDVIKNGNFVHRIHPDRVQAEFKFVDDSAEPGESYYYVRVIQRDGEMAWGSPAWVVYK